MKKLSTLMTLLAVFSFLSWTGTTATAQPTCQAGFVYSIGTVTPNGATVSLFDSSWANGNIVAWNWDFGNGTGSILANPVTSFPPGYHYVCLTITAIFQNQTCTSTSCDTIFISGTQPCNASFTYNISPGGVQFAASSGNNMQYSWDFGDSTFSSLPNPVHNYNSPGTYVACLTVTNSAGQTCTSCQTIVIPNTTTCNAFFQWYPDTVTGGIQFQNGSTGGGNYSWNFGNNQTSTVQDPLVMYNTPGNYLVCLTVYDSITQCSDTYCDTIVVTGTGTGCTANFSYQLSPAGGAFFSAAVQSNATWNWDFGNGSTGTGPNASTTYTPGTYTVCLTVAMNGVTCTSCQVITVQGNSGCSSNFALYPDTLIAHNYFLVNLATGVAPLTYTWSWGDGTTSTGAYPSHTYATGGLYTICCTITDATGCTSTTCYPFQLLRLMGSSVPVTINVIPGPTGLNENTELQGLSIYPNPATDNFTTEFELNESADISISLINLSGQKVQTISSLQLGAGSHIFEISAGNLSKGLYFLEIDRNGQKTYSKIMLQ